MNSSSTQNLVEKPRVLLVFGTVIIVLFLVTNLPWELDDYDQAQQAFTSFEMVKEGHWFYQRVPQLRYVPAQKPPLVAWTSAVFFALTRSWDISWRLPSFLAAMTILILLLRVATSAYGTAPGVVAFSAFGLNLLSVRLATLVRTDMPLALVVFLSGVLIWKKVRKREEWEAHDQLLMFILLSAALWIKGPTVYAFLLPGIALFEWRARKEDIGHAWCGWWPWAASLAGFLLWVVGGLLFVHGFWHEVVLREFLGRFSGTVHRAQPVYFYLFQLLHKFAPWSVLMILIAAGSARVKGFKVGKVLRQVPPDVFWLMCWSLGGLVVMSLIPSKRTDRIFPVIPPLCLLLAAQLAQGLRDERHVKRIMQWSAFSLLFAAAFVSIYTFSKVATGYRHDRDSLVAFARAVRREADAHHWRYEVISIKKGEDHGMLLYMQKPHFIRPDDAIAEWNRGAVDALVAPSEVGLRLVSELKHASLSQLKVVQQKSEGGMSYVFLTRQDQAQ
jgi:4-amino-4-deoxy-L-arabinose transferase-like glycosyltransferase